MASKSRPPDPDRLVREAAGRYRTEDGRFAVEQESAGRWVLVDAEQTDELGLPRVRGPFGSLDAVRSAIVEVRERPAEESPLAGRVTGKGKRAASRAAPTEPAAPPAARPRPPTWLERLPAGERGRAERLVAGLDRLGVPDPESVVRRDLEGDLPAIVEAVLAHRLATIVDGAGEPRRLAEAVGGEPAARTALEAALAAGVDAAAIGAIVRAAVRAAIGEAVEVMARGPGRGRSSDLPSWRLLESGDRARAVDPARAGRR